MEVHATLRIMAEGLDPDEVSALFDTKPDRAHRRGDSRRTDTGRVLSPYSSGMWSHDSAQEPAASLEAHLLDLLNFAREHLRELIHLREKGATIDLFIGVFASDSNLGLCLEPEVLKQIGDLELTLGLDVYCCGD